jgi:hypothetical protein
MLRELLTWIDPGWPLALLALGVLATGLAAATREWAYDKTSAIGSLDKALDEAKPRGWTVVSMKDDWKRVFPFDTK